MLRKSPPLYLDTHMLPCREQTEGRKPTYTNGIQIFWVAVPAGFIRKLYPQSDKYRYTEHRQRNKGRNNPIKPYKTQARTAREKTVYPAEPSTGGVYLIDQIAIQNTECYNNSTKLHRLCQHQRRSNRKANHHHHQEKTYTKHQQEPGRKQRKLYRLGFCIS